MRRKILIIGGLLVDLRSLHSLVIGFVYIAQQEIWISRYKEQLGVPVMIGVGGSLDVIGGFKQRAPELFIKLNLEWFYRLVSEPSRLKRQMVLPRFAGRVLREKHRKRS